MQPIRDKERERETEKDFQGLILLASTLEPKMVKCTWSTAEILGTNLGRNIKEKHLLKMEKRRKPKKNIFMFFKTLFWRENKIFFCLFFTRQLLVQNKLLENLKMEFQFIKQISNIKFLNS